MYNKLMYEILEQEQEKAAQCGKSRWLTANENYEKNILINTQKEIDNRLQYIFTIIETTILENKRVTFSNSIRFRSVTNKPILTYIMCVMDSLGFTHKNLENDFYEISWKENDHE